MSSLVAITAGTPAACKPSAWASVEQALRKTSCSPLPAGQELGQAMRPQQQRLAGAVLHQQRVAVGVAGEMEDSDAVAPALILKDGKEIVRRQGRPFHQLAAPGAHEGIEQCAQLPLLVGQAREFAVAGDGLCGKGEEDDGRRVEWCSAGHSWIGRVDDIRSGAIIVPHFPSPDPL